MADRPDFENSTPPQGGKTPRAPRPSESPASEAIEDASLLHPLDAQAIDALLLARLEGGQPPEWLDGQRLKAAEAWLGLIETLPVEEPSDELIERTLAGVERQRQVEWVVGQIQPGPDASESGIAFRWNELIGVAAVLLISLSLVWPLLSQARQDARRIACSSHLAAAGVGLSRYAMDFAGLLPRHQAEPGDQWAKVGSGPDREGRVRSNSANLVLGIQTAHLFADVLACPGNPFAMRSLPEDAWDYPNLGSISYSYQSQFTPEPQRLEDRPRTIVLADKNPLLGFGQGQVVVFLRDRGIQSATAMHNWVGQNALHADGRVNWMREPVTESGDNIWLPEGREEFRTFRETPAHDDDILLIP
ncbi:MAG: hypothetical protein JJU36_04940 [Phycisphaeraceae bacterium]|nr:hypothetical protein [Phycisphaeraceae bacterium]